MEGLYHVAHHGVVQDDVGRAELIEQRFVETCALFRANTNFDLILLIVLALRDDIDPDNGNVQTEVAFPHLQRTAEPATNLQED